MILSLTSNASGAVALPICNDGVTTGYELLQGAAFGAPVWDHAFSAPRGTQGARPSQGTLPNREVQLPIRVAGSSKDDMANKVRALALVVDDLRRFGGTCRMRSKAQTYPQNFDVLTASIDMPEWNNRLEHRFMAVIAVRLICGPYVLGDPYDVEDGFSIDNVNGGDLNYTADAGALTNVSVTGGVLSAVANAGSETRLIFTGRGYTYGDHQATVKFNAASALTNYKAGVVLNRTDASNYLAAYVDDTGAVSRLRVDKVVAGVTTNLASSNLAVRITSFGGSYAWVRGRIEGNVVYAEYFIGYRSPYPTTTPTLAASYTLTPAEAALFGAGSAGMAGMVWTPQTTTSYLDDFEVLPFTYASPTAGYVLDTFGAIPGDAPATASVRLANATNGPYQFGIFGWAARPSVENYVGNGDLESGSSAPWSSAAVAGVNGAATSISSVSATVGSVAPKFGEFYGQIVTPATANTGAAYPMHRRFRKGITYTATMWLRASSGTTAARIRLGVSGDIASSSALALSSTWTQHTATWTPAADVNLAYLVAEVTAATATTFQIDAACVYQGTTAPTGRQAEGAGAPGVLAAITAESDIDGVIAGLTRTTDATAEGGFSMAVASVPAFGVTYTGQWWIDPDLIPHDDYTRTSTTIEVWARVKVHSTLGTITATASLNSDQFGTSAPVYTSEFGSAGRTIPKPGGGVSLWRNTRLGTFDLPANRKSPSRYVLQVAFAIAAATNAQPFAIDTIYVMPSRSRFLSPSGKTYTVAGWPQFFVSNPNGNLSRTVRSDLSSTMKTDQRVTAAGGINGSLVEMPTGPLSVFGFASTFIPDDPAPASAGVQDVNQFPPLHVAVTPRFHWLRGT